MNKNNLKQVLRPLIKECIKEVIFEDGFLSGVVTEVLVGVQAAGAMPISEQEATITAPAPARAISNRVSKGRERERRNKIQQTRHQMAEAIGRDAYNGVNLFEGIEPIAKAGTAGTKSAAPGPLSGVDPNDPGVDISALFGARTSWSK